MTKVNALNLMASFGRAEYIALLFELAYANFASLVCAYVFIYAPQPRFEINIC